jgi:hypothetical protein
MGGYGSTRWNSHSKKHAVEDGLVFSIKKIYSSLIHEGNSILTWNRNSDMISYRVIRGEQRPSAVQLSYTCNGQEINSFIDLTITPLPWGGHRYWFSCPNLIC